MPAKRLVSERQWDILLSFLMKHKTLANTGLGQSHLWNQLANRLNAVPGGMAKSPIKWREYWSNAKCSVRKKSRDGRFELTLREKKILQIVGVLTQSEETMEKTAAAQPIIEFVGDSSSTTEDAEKLSQPSSKPTQSSSKPTQPSSKPTQPSSKPTQPSSKPTQPSSKPTQPSSKPTQPSSKPTQPSSKPTQPSSKPTQPSSKPTYSTNLMGPPPSPPRDIQQEEYADAAPWVLAFQRERLKLKEKKLEFELQVAMQKQREAEHRTIVLQRMATALARIANDVSAIRTQVDRRSL